MDNFSKTIRISNLLDVYGKLLTEKQRRVLTEFFNFNGSLSEIAEELKVSRQAVSDLIKRTVKLLEGYETKLMVLEKLTETHALLAEDGKKQKKLNKIWGI